MKILVLGGAGKMAMGAILDLVESPEVHQVILADRNEDALRKRAAELASGKVVYKTVDVNDAQRLVSVLQGSDCCINTTYHYFNVQVMQACMEAKCHYVDLGGLFHWARRQMELHEDFKKAGITAILGLGSAIGIVNVMARYAYDRLDTVEYVRIRDGIVSKTDSPSPFVAPYALPTILDEFCLNPYEFVNGEWKEMTPFAGEEIVHFPEPIGTQVAFDTLHSEVATIPVSFKDKGIQEVTFKLSLPKEFEQKLRFLVALGLGGTEPITVDGVPVNPRNFLLSLTDALNKKYRDSRPAEPRDYKCLRVDVKGTKAGKEMLYRLETIVSTYRKWWDEYGVTMGAYSVGFPCAIGARMLAGGIINTPGAFPPEMIVPPEIYFPELAQREIFVYSTVKEPVY